MSFTVRSSTLRRSQTLTLLRQPGPAAEQRRAQIPVLWPRYVPGPGGVRQVRLEAIDPRRIPPGWQSVQIHVPMRLATCEETDCPFFLRGWTEVEPAPGKRTAVAGAMNADEAAARFGLYGARELAPALVHHPPGTPCPRVHKLPSGVPPLYTVNGRPTLWSEFEDAIGGGLHHAAQLNAAGR